MSKRSSLHNDIYSKFMTEMPANFINLPKEKDDET